MMHAPRNASSLPERDAPEVTRQIDEDGRPREVSEPLDDDSLTRTTREENEVKQKMEAFLPHEPAMDAAKKGEPSPDSEQIPPESYEEQHVHQVYEQIASHFSSTRYKPWPIVESFLQSLAPGSIGLDIGCGNGKYLAVNKDIFIIGSDRSSNLVRIARRHEPHAAVVADSLSLPHPDGRFDFAICIAVVHHLSTRARRAEAVGAVLRCLRAGGRALVYVWALEQRGSRRGWDEGGEQDVMVPWVMKSGRRKKKKKKKKIEEGPEEPELEKTFQRYYHLYRKGELEEDVVTVGGEVVKSGYEKDNWWAICRKGPRGMGLEGLGLDV